LGQDDTALMEKFGGFLASIEAAQSALDKSLSAHAASAQNIDRLTKFAAAALQKLEAQTTQLGARAEQGGAQAVRDEAQKSLGAIAGEIGGAARAAVKPIIDETSRQIDEARRGALSLDREAQRFSERAFVFIAAGAFIALLLVALSVWGSLAWQRSELASLAEQKAALRDEVAAMQATAQKMRAQGLKIEFGNCSEKGRQRLCVAAQPGVQPWGTDAAPFCILKGY
jgi:hypothetical protein